MLLPQQHILAFFFEAVENANYQVIRAQAADNALLFLLKILKEAGNSLERYYRYTYMYWLLLEDPLEWFINEADRDIGGSANTTESSAHFGGIAITRAVIYGWYDNEIGELCEYARGRHCVNRRANVRRDE